MLSNCAKTFGFKGKGASVGVSVDTGILSKINRYALKDLGTEEVFARKQLLAHNGVDRDRERFPEELLDDFAATLPGKNVLYFHNKGQFLPLGLYFDAATEVMSVERFKELTGADPKLPEGTDQVKVLWAWYYVVKTPDVESVLANIEGGVYRHWSVGFAASDLVGIKKEVNGPTLYYEYASPGEALEGSLVWLGAQQGATSQKSAGKHLESEPAKKEKSMKKILMLLGAVLGKAFGDETTEEQLVESVKSALSSKDAEIASLKQKIGELEPLAADGKGYRESLVADFVRMKAALGEADSDETKQTGIKSFAAAMPMDMLKTEVKHLESRMKEKFPDGQIKPGDPNENRGKGTKGADDNPLIVSEAR